MKTPQTAEKTICPNCEQWQNNVKENASAGLYSDCFNDCAERGLSPKIQTCVIPVTPAQAPQTSHSPLPWTQDFASKGMIRDEQDTIVAEHLHVYDAAFIVRACNNAQRLADNASRLANWMQRNASTEDTEAMLYVVEAQKALAQWKGVK